MARKPLFRFTVYAPKVEDPTETTVLTPIAGAAHADPFVLTTLQGIAGSKPYLGFPKGSTGTLDPITKKTTTGNYALPVFDPRVTPGGANAVRWTTAFLGDALGRSRLKGCRFTLERALDGQAASLVPFFAGRIRDVAMEADPLWITLDLKDFADDLNVDLFTALPDPSATYAAGSAVLPVGLPRRYGPFPAGPLLRGTFRAGGFLDTDLSQDPARGIICRPTQAASVSPALRVVRTVTVGTGAVGYFEWRQIGAGLPVQGRNGVTHYRYQWFALGPLKTSDLRYTSLPAAGTVVDFSISNDAPPTEFLPLLIDEVHPVQFMADIADGKFRRRIGDTALRPIVGRDASPGGPWDTLLQDASFGTIRMPVTSSARANVFLEKLCKAKNLGWRLDRSGKLVPVDYRRTNTSLATALTLTDDDLVTDVAPKWNDSRDGAITAVEYTYYAEQQLTTLDLLASADEYPAISPTLIVAGASSVVALNDLSTLRDVGEKVIKIDGIGSRVSGGELTPSGQNREETLIASIGAEMQEFLRPYASGTVKASATYLAGGNAESVEPGSVRLVQHKKLPDPATNQRGGIRLMLCLSRQDTDGGIALTWLDCGANTVAAVPAITAIASLGQHVAAVDVTLNAATDPAEIWVCPTEPSVAVRPAATDGGWMLAARLDASGTATLDDLPSARRLWIRARSQGAGGALAQPSAFVFPAGAGYVDLGVLAAPSGVAVAAPYLGYADVTWTPGITTEATELLVVAGGAPGSWPDSSIVTRLEAGTTKGRIYLTTPGATYTVGVRHRDLFGGTSAVASATFTASSTAETLAVPMDPQPFAGPQGAGLASGGALAVLRQQSQYGLGVIATTFPGAVEFREAVETGPGTGTYSGYTTVGVESAVVGNWTTITRSAANDGRRRRLSARTVREGSTSGWCADVEVLPWSARILLPPLGPPSLVVNLTPDPVTDLLEYSGTWDSLLLSIDGGPWALPPASPIPVTLTSTPQAYTFLVARNGVSSTTPVSIPARTVATPAFTTVSIALASDALDRVLVDWGAANVPTGATFDVTVFEQTALFNPAVGTTTTFYGETAPYTYQAAADLDVGGARTKRFTAYVEMFDGAALVATSATAQVTLNSN